MQIERQFLSATSIKQTCETDRNFWDRDMELGEIKSELYNMKKGKTPGVDSLSCEFYNFAGDDIGCFLLRSLQYAYAHSSSSITQRQGIITCILRGDKSRDYLKH